MRRVNGDDARISQFGREARQETCFRTVAMDNVESPCLYQAIKVKQRSRVLCGMDVPLHWNFVDANSASFNAAQVLQKARIGTEWRVGKRKIESCYIEIQEQ